MDKENIKIIHDSYIKRNKVIKDNLVLAKIYPDDENKHIIINCAF